MAIRVAIFAIPTVAVIGVVLLLNGLDAGTGIAVAALGSVAVLSGAAMGYFADRLPELPRARRHEEGTRRFAGAHHSRH
jgi:energy-converting hydrogenase Eha subunit A